MPSTQSLNITLSDEMANMVKAKVRSGEYDTESDVIYDGLRALADRDEAIEKWLDEEVVPTYDEVVADRAGTTESMKESWDWLQEQMNKVKAKQDLQK